MTFDKRNKRAYATYNATRLLKIKAVQSKDFSVYNEKAVDDLVFDWTAVKLFTRSDNDRMFDRLERAYNALTDEEKLLYEIIELN